MGLARRRPRESAGRGVARWLSVEGWVERHRGRPLERLSDEPRSPSAEGAQTQVPRKVLQRPALQRTPLCRRIGITSESGVDVDGESRVTRWECAHAVEIDTSVSFRPQRSTARARQTRSLTSPARQPHASLSRHLEAFSTSGLLRCAADLGRRVLGDPLRSIDARRALGTPTPQAAASGE